VARASPPSPLRCWSPAIRPTDPLEGAIDAILQALAGLPPLLTYLVLGAGAAAENLAPPIPADTFVLFGAFLSAQGRARPWLVWLVTWLPNSASALVVYGLSRHYGGRFFRTRIGRLLLHPRQLETVHRFYHRWGPAAIFVSRFLPGFRAVVPLFAGVSHVGALRAGTPIVLASALWYGCLVYLGAQAGRNWPAIEVLLSRYSGLLLAIALPLLGVLLVWWVRSRRFRRIS
jgi:membrane protein DedA with SNARE-associated domain